MLHHATINMVSSVINYTGVCVCVCVYLDLKKALEKVSHTRLLWKMQIEVENFFFFFGENKQGEMTR